METNKLQEILGDKLIKVEGGAISTVEFSAFNTGFAAKGEYVALYFGAHWAPPSRLFTTTLKDKFYTKLNEDQEFAGKVEVIFVTDDRAPDHFERNFKQMPWYAIPYTDEHRRANLKSKYGICELPTLVVISADTGEVVTHDGKNNVSDGKGALAKWKEMKSQSAQ
mgnify:FL=1